MTTQFVPPARVCFTPGRSYYGRSICDSEAITTMLVLRRTRCTVCVTIEGRPGVKTLRPYLYNGIEHVRPNGNYSMALSIGADREVACEAPATVIPFPVKRSEHNVRRAVRAYVQGDDAVEAVLNEAITLEGDTITVEALRVDEVIL